MFHNPGKEGNVSETVMNCQLMYLIMLVIEKKGILIERNICTVFLGRKLIQLI